MELVNTILRDRVKTANRMQEDAEHYFPYQALR